MRVFVGIELSEDAVNSLKDVQDSVRPYVERGNLTIPSNFHLTIWFLGEVHGELLKLVEHGVQNIANHYKPFDLTLGPLGAFEKKNRFILWGSVSKGEEALNELFAEFVKEFKLIGLHPDPRGINPHITLGRQLSLLDTIEDLSERYPVQATQFKVDHLTIFESKRVDDVLRYIPVKRVHLNG